MQSYSPLILTSQSVLRTKANKDDVEFRFNLLQPRSQGPLSSPLGDSVAAGYVSPRKIKSRIHPPYGVLWSTKARDQLQPESLLEGGIERTLLGVSCI